MDRATFCSRFGGVYEHTPWICESAWDAGLVNDVVQANVSSALPPILEKYFEEHASTAQKLSLLTSYPDLAGKLSVAKELSVESAQEHEVAGLDQCSPGELADFQKLNTE